MEPAEMADQITPVSWPSVRDQLLADIPAIGPRPIDGFVQPQCIERADLIALEQIEHRQGPVELCLTWSSCV